MFLVGGIPVYRSVPGKDVAYKTLKLLMKLMSDQVQKNKRPVKEFLAFCASFRLCMVCFGALALIVVECMINCNIFQINCLIWELC